MYVLGHYATWCRWLESCLINLCQWSQAHSLEQKVENGFFGCREELTFVLCKKEKQNKVLKCRIVYVFPWSLICEGRNFNILTTFHKIDVVQGCWIIYKQLT